jgi:hypothetical protein
VGWGKKKVNVHFSEFIPEPFELNEAELKVNAAS